jgi:protein-S-isoprenylcysteine O-methyltransferase Ste14
MKILERYLVMKIGLRGLFEWIVIISSGVLGYRFSILLLPYPFLIVGVILLVTGVIIHILSHIHHPQAHKKTEEITYVVTKGIYSKIRHPGYLGIILGYIGIALFFRTTLSLILSFIFSILLIMTAIEEERRLSKFHSEYENYKEKVKWRFIPKVF